jgi:hypothetical protein
MHTGLMHIMSRILWPPAQIAMRQADVGGRMQDAIRSYAQQQGLEGIVAVSRTSFSAAAASRKPTRTESMNRQEAILDFVCPSDLMRRCSLPFTSASEVVAPVAAFLELNDVRNQLVVAVTIDRLTRNRQGWHHLLMVCATRRCQLAVLFWPREATKDIAEDGLSTLLGPVAA